MEAANVSVAVRNAERFYLELQRATVRQRARLLKRAPWGDIQTAALHHPDAAGRWWALCVLDHCANDASMHVFAAALRDPDVRVRNAALHSLACEGCKTGELCVADVVPGLCEVLAHDPEPDLRVKALQSLLWLAGEDGRARAAIERVARNDPDPVLRRAATGALAGHWTAPRKRYERTQRRHAGAARRV